VREVTEKVKKGKEHYRQATEEVMALGRKLVGEDYVLGPPVAVPQTSPVVLTSPNVTHNVAPQPAQLSHQQQDNPLKRKVQVAGTGIGVSDFFFFVGWGWGWGERMGCNI
jgi:hypothetical protein